MKAPETTSTSRAGSPAARELFRNVLSTPAKAADRAACVFLQAVQQLFPERIAELENLGRAYLEEAEADAFKYGTDDDDPFLNYGVLQGDVYDGLEDRVEKWTEKNRIACAAVDKVATRLAAGLGFPQPIESSITWSAPLDVRV